MLQKAFDFASVLFTFPLWKLPFHSEKNHDMIKLSDNHNSKGNPVWHCIYFRVSTKYWCLSCLMKKIQNLNLWKKSSVATKPNSSSNYDLLLITFCGTNWNMWNFTEWYCSTAMRTSTFGCVLIASVLQYFAFCCCVDLRLHLARHRWKSKEFSYFLDGDVRIFIFAYFLENTCCCSSFYQNHHVSFSRLTQHIR